MSEFNKYVSSYDLKTEIEPRVQRGDDRRIVIPQAANHVSVSYEYLNGLGKNITVVERSGLTFEIPPLVNPWIREFVIRVQVTAGRGVIVNTSRIEQCPKPTSKLIMEILNEGSAKNFIDRTQFTMDYLISISELESNGGTVYLKLQDIVLSLQAAHNAPHHPYSERALYQQLVYGEEFVNRLDRFGYNIYIVDRSNRFGVRFININDQIYRIPVDTTSTSLEGVYVITSGPVTGNHNSKPVAHRFNFEDADAALRLYRSPDEAKALGDVMLEKEQRLKEIAVELKEREQLLKEEKLKKEAEFEEFKRKIEKERLEDEARRKQEEAEMIRKATELKEQLANLEYRRNMEAIERKSYYEERSLNRKDSSETVKFIPLIATGILAAVAAFLRFK